jgi:hypothetical protein
VLTADARWCAAVRRCREMSQVQQSVPPAGAVDWARHYRRAVLFSPSRRTGMGDLARIEIERDVADAAARRAAEEGLTVASYISLLLRRSFERAPGEESVLVYDHVGVDGEFHIDREPGESDESFSRRAALYDGVFGRRS